MIGMMLTLRASGLPGLAEAVDGKGPAAYRGLVETLSAFLGELAQTMGASQAAGLAGVA